MKFQLKSCVVVAVAGFLGLAHAQAVKTVNEPYQAELPIAPAAAAATSANQAPVAQAVPLQPTTVFDIQPGEKTLREVLARWATNAGWVHNPEHWSLDRDLPIVGTADASYFGSDFKEAARRLISSSELTDRPVQPCFYLNKVVRVVPLSELCDKTSAAHSM